MNDGIGTEIPRASITQEIFNLFQPREGFNSVYYGRVRNGKTYAATADILELLERGEVVLANWPIDFKGFDERKSFRHVLVKTFFGRRLFYQYSADNFIYFHPDDLENPVAEVNIKFLGRLVGVHVFIDEGQWIFNSQVRVQDVEKRKLILHGGHYCRSLNIITQRPQNVFRDIRSQIQFWHKCEKRLTWPALIFERTTFEDMKEDLPDEESKPSAHKVYMADPLVFAAYNTHAMRGDDAIDVTSDFRVFDFSFKERLALLLSFFVKSRGRHEGAYAPVAADLVEDELDASAKAYQVVLGSFGAPARLSEKAVKKTVAVYKDIALGQRDRT